MTVYPAQADIRCADGSNINIEIGDRQFSIPIDYKIHIISLNGTDITPVNRETWAGCKKSKLKKLSTTYESEASRNFRNRGKKGKRNCAT